MTWFIWMVLPESSGSETGLIIRNVMKIYPVRDGSRFLYHLCEYIEGQSLRQWLHDTDKPSLDQVRDITEQIIRGLRAFSASGNGTP